MFMKKVGIICEYNPFHNGHIYHLEKIKEMFPDSMIILVMSGSFTMRGELSLLNKWDKTMIALQNGVDLSVELSTFYSTNSADIFAKGAIKILKELDCNYLVFGSECNDIDFLYDLAKTQIENDEYNEKVKYYMDLGNNYPTSMSKALKDICGKTISLPNDILGLSYIKQIIIQKANIKPITILRTNDYHDNLNNKKIASATSIRKALLEHHDISFNVPKETLDKIIRINYEEKLFTLLKYQILINMNNLNNFLDVDEGLDNLIRKNILKVKNYQELVNKIKTKRYTYNRINRMFTHILLNIKKDDVEKLKQINYIRILGFSKKGKNYLKEIRKKTTIPIITNYSDLKDDNLSFELYFTNIYNMITNQNNLNLAELKSIPIQKED